jgi:ribonuclease-3 family protein
MDLRNLAYLGDAVWELHVREITTQKVSSARALHKATTDLVNAEFQCKLLGVLESVLTPDEFELARRARNLSIPSARKSIQAQYRQATAFEALIGWWYVNDKPRLEFIKSFLAQFITD